MERFHTNYQILLKIGHQILLKIAQWFFRGSYLCIYLRPGISNVQIVQRDILDDLLLLVNISFRQWDIFFCF